MCTRTAEGIARPVNTHIHVGSVVVEHLAQLEPHGELVRLLRDEVVVLADFAHELEGTPWRAHDRHSDP